MTYERFSQLWQALVTNRAPCPTAQAAPAISNGMSEQTSQAFIAYGRGDKSLVIAAKARLATAKAKLVESKG